MSFYLAEVMVEVELEIIIAARSTLNGDIFGQGETRRFSYKKVYQL